MVFHKNQKNILDFFINNNAYDTEIYLKDYVFLSIKKIMEINNFYNKDNVYNIIDLGYTYKGMGWIETIYYNTKFNKLFFRLDGGSNIYDREINYKKMKELSKIDNIESIDTKDFDFEEILNL